jgi:hypothetical protein
MSSLSKTSEFLKLTASEPKALALTPLDAILFLGD